MSGIDASQLLRAGLLEGVPILLARTGGDPAEEAGAQEAGAAAAAVHAACSALGARVRDCPLPPREAAELDEPALERAVAAALDEMGAIEMLIVDAAGLFARRRAGPQAGGELGAPAEVARAGLIECMEWTFAITRAVVNGAYRARGVAGRIIYLAPAAGAGEHAEAARAGLENLARTLSIEWARHGITPVALAPGRSTGARELAALCAYLASPAGAYFSGCLLEIGGPPPAR